MRPTRCSSTRWTNCARSATGMPFCRAWSRPRSPTVLRTASRVLADGRPIDLGEVVNLANCRQTAPCSSAAMDAATAERPWGAEQPALAAVRVGFLERPLASGRELAVLRGRDGGRTIRPRTMAIRCCDGATPCAPGSGWRVQSWNGPYRTARRSVRAFRRAQDPRGDDLPERRRAGARRITMTASIRQVSRILSWREVR